MKRNFFLCAIFFSIVLNDTSVKAQLIENGDFLIQNPGLYTPLGCNNMPNSGTSHTFIDGSIPNWYRSHGTPNICPISQQGNGCTGVLSHSIEMEDIGGVGEGIVGGYPFRAGETYEIHLGIVSMNVNNRFIMRAQATNPQGNHPSDDDCFHICLSDDVNGIAPGNSAHETFLDPEHGFGLPSLTLGDNLITYSPTANFDWVMFFPLDKNEGCHTTDVVVNYIWINRKCKEEKIIDVFQNNPQYYNTEPYYTSYYKVIKVGSKYGSFPIADINGKTSELTASQYILIEDDFLAKPKYNSNHFIAQINNKMCDYFPENMGEGEIVSGEEGGKPYPSLNLIETPIEKVKIYPNPNTGEFSVNFPNKDEWQLIVVNYLGQTVYSNKVNQSTQTNVILDNSVTSGNYLLFITSSSGSRFTERLSVIRD